MKVNLRAAFLALALSIMTLNAAFSLPIDCGALLRATDAIETIKNFVDFTQKHKFDADLLPFVDAEKIGNLQYVQRGGQRNYGTYEGDFEGRQVFIKTIAYYEEGGMREAFWFQFLNAHGLGAKFIGITRMNDNWGIVTERLDGLNVKTRIKLTENQINEINIQINKLFDLGIYPKDLQFVITEKGPVLIDPELFTTYGEKNEFNRAYFLKEFNTLLQVLARETD